MKRYTFIIVAILVAIAVFFIVTYNSLIKKEEAVKKQWSEVQATYQRRIDLIPSLVNVVKGQADFESTTLLQITEARNKAAAVTISGDEIAAGKFNQQVKLQDDLASAANKLLISLEAFPALKGTAAFAGLQAQLEGTERRIKFARKDFNEAIASYNNSVRNFPAKIVAGMFGFKPREGFQSDTGANKSIEINFN
ncbi:MAG: LemA family protein [Chitinophagaceae bacterium]|nr:LemA family protein [Chitinophagaceae bacterium]